MYIYIYRERQTNKHTKPERQRQTDRQRKTLLDWQIEKLSENERHTNKNTNRATTKSGQNSRLSSSSLLLKTFGSMPPRQMSSVPHQWTTSTRVEQVPDAHQFKRNISTRVITLIDIIYTHIYTHKHTSLYT